MLEPGTNVRIVNYGHIVRVSTFFYPEEPKNTIAEIDGWWYVDMSPELIGQEGTIDEARLIQGKETYSLKGPNCVAWYNRDQLEVLWKT
jgi:hypothetical protein